MYAFLVIGMTGQGKSDFVKQMIKGRNAHVFDINNEYYFPRINVDAQGNKARIQFSEEDCKKISRDTSFDEDRFVSDCLNKKDCYLIFEDATGFFEGKIPKDLKRVIVAKRHKNIYPVFLFHSIQDVPPALVRLCNYVILFKTNDELETVEKKYQKLIEPFKKLQNAPKYSKLMIKLIDQ